MKLTREQIQALAKQTLATRPAEIDCDEWLDRVGRFLEAQAAGEALTPELQAVAQHIEVCPECDEELALLLAALEADSLPESK